MSLGDTIRGLIDPMPPAARAWLQRELPRLVRDGFIDAAQADRIAQRYGVRVNGVAAEGALARPPQQPDGPSPAHAAQSDEGTRVATTAPAQPPEGSGAPAGAFSAVPAAPVGPGSSPAASVAAGRTAASPFLADHAVSIVLYLGAFLVVAAVVIFLAYSWGDIGGGTKLAVLASLTAGFLGAAGLCLPRPAVRPAGRTFLALGAILVPANVAATYLVYFDGGPIPGAVFWLLGALISGGFHALLSLRLGSRVYGVMATLSVPVATCALAWLIVSSRSSLDQAWVLGPAAGVGLVAVLAVTHWSPSVSLVQAARVVAVLLLPVAFLTSLPFLEESDAGQYGAPVTLLLMSGGLAWEALRRGQTWWIGAVAMLLMLLPITTGLAITDASSLFVDAVMLSTLIPALAARRLDSKQSILWDLAALLPALAYPFAAWDQSWSSLQLFASLGLVSVIAARGRRASWPLYALILAVDGSYVRLLEIYGSPESPTWALGVALWPLGVLWVLLGTVLPRRPSGVAWLGALVTLPIAVILTWDQPTWCAGIALTGALGAVVAAWRLRLAPVLLLAVPWLLLAGVQGASLLNLESPSQWIVAGVSGWLLFAVSSRRPAAPERASEKAPAPSAQEATGRTPEEAASPTPGPGTGGDADRGTAVRVRLLDEWAPAIQWPLMARLGALGVAGFAALLLLAAHDRGDAWLVATTVAWLNVALILGAWAALTRSRDLTVVAALAVVPALYAGIARLHPTDGQAFAIPIGLYLLAIAAMTRLDRRPVRTMAASTIAALGLLILLGTGIVQTLDREHFGYALLTLAEGLILVGVGIAIRWRVLVVGGVAGVVAIAVRQLFDAVAALPGWAILGGSGMLLLGIAVALLLARARLVAAGRSVAERWSGWD